MNMLPYLLIATSLTFLACAENNEPPMSSVDPVNWEGRKVSLEDADSLVRGSSYLSVYSEIYQLSEQKTYNLTATVSMRNISSTDSVFILHADYYDTKGDLIRTYLNHPVYIQPLETIEIVIDESDQSGGTGANFIVEWATPSQGHEPLLEAVMISTTGQQGLSFTTQGVKR